nr:hypothetical protein [uncultured bacterium]
MTDEERRAFLEELDQENLASMTPFERYLYDNGLFDDVIRPEITVEDVVIERSDLCADVGCEECIGYWKRDGRVSYCTHECHTNFKATEVPYKHCSYKGCVNCPEIVRQGVVISHCTCAHHRFVQ